MRRSILSLQFAAFALAANACGQTNLHLLLRGLRGADRLQSSQSPVVLQPQNTQWLKSFDGKNSFNLWTDPRFTLFLQQTFENLKIAFWSDKQTSEVIPEFLSAPGPVQVENHRFVTASGRVAHAGFNRGLLWVDTHEEADGPIVVFVAVEDPPGSLWLYSNRNFYDDPSSLPHNLLLNINKWVRVPVKPVLRLSKATIMDTSGVRGKEVAPEILEIPLSRWNAAVAQGPPPVTLPGQGLRPFGPLIDSHGPTMTVPGAPFQAQRTGQSVKKLADGSSLTEAVHGQITRDSEGRVRIEQTTAGQPLTVVVIDPINHISLRWDNSSTVATQTAVPRELHVTFPLLTVPLFPAVESETELRDPDKVTHQDLGQKTINGIMASGARTTTIVPNGKIVHEVWFSEEFKLAVLDTIENPLGKQTIEMRDVMHVQADPTLFHLPQGYQVKPQSPLPSGGLAGGISSGRRSTPQ